MIELRRGPGGVSLAAEARGASADGDVTFIETDSALSGSDGDTAPDVYAIEDGAATLVSDRVQAGVDGAEDARFAAASADGSRVYVTTDESLVAGDTDSVEDTYEWFGGSISLVTDRIQGGSDSNDIAGFLAASRDGSSVAWITEEPLVGADGDADDDLYVRSAGETRLVSDRVQAGADAAILTVFEEMSKNGATVAFRTAEPLVSADDDAALDVYTVSLTGGGTPAPVLRSGRATGGAPSALSVSFDDLTDDGSTVAFSTNEPLVATDGDTATDIYLAGSGGPVLASDRRQGGSDAAVDADAAAFSPSGATVFFETNEALVTSDTDSSRDVFSFTTNTDTTTLISDDTAGASDPSVSADLDFAADDGAYFHTSESLDPADTDTSRDVYFGSGAAPKPLTDGTGADAAVITTPFAAVGGRLVFFTTEALTTNDTDTVADVYENDGSGARLVSGPAESGAVSLQGAMPFAVSEDGGTIAFTTNDPLVVGDTDAAPDLYASVIPPPPPPPPTTGGGTGDPGGPAPAGPAPVAPAPPAPPASPPVILDRLAPGLTTLRVTPTRIVQGKQGTISFKLSEPARVTLTFKRRASRKRLVSAGRTTVNARAGTTKVMTSKRLKPGSYEVTVVAVDAAGNKAAARKLKFTVVKKRKR